MGVSDNRGALLDLKGNRLDLELKRATPIVGIPHMWNQHVKCLQPHFPAKEMSVTAVDCVLRVPHFPLGSLECSWRKRKP